MLSRDVRGGLWPAVVALALLLVNDGGRPAGAAPAGPARRILAGHRPAAAAGLAAVDRVPPESRIRLALCLRLGDPDGLARFLQDLADPASPAYRRYLTPAEFAARFSGPAADCDQVAEFARGQGLVVTRSHPSRLVLDVEGTAAAIERAFSLRLNTYRHPKEGRVFRAPDADPSIPADLPVEAVAGLDDYWLPRPQLRPLQPLPEDPVKPFAGSGPGGSYLGRDFRAAYVPGTVLTGAGQAVGLLEFDGFYPADITAYENLAGLQPVPLTVVPVNGGFTVPSTNNVEVALDIEVAMSMAPALSRIYVYEAPLGTPWVSLLSAMANDNLVRQMSCSWGGGFNPNPAAETVFMQMAAQGQSFFAASGDSDAYTGNMTFPTDSPNITQVGGTSLTTSGPGGAYVSETAWNRGGGVGTGGGISLNYPIPSYQQGVAMTNNLGSTTMRNVPDVALTAESVYVAYNNGAGTLSGGTSISAPLWAGFTALVNQQAVNNGRPPVGFLNPALYAVGKGGGYGASFHDTTTGNNFWLKSTNLFPAVAGYDLCTGWGTPTGTNMIFALAGTPVPAPASNSFTLLIEACTNGVVDPGETVTVAFGLKNAGGFPTTNLVATLLAGGGVIPLSGPQVYGALSNSQSLALPFTFIATGSCGASNTATLQLQDGGVFYGPATFSFQLGRSSTVTVNNQSFDAVVAPALPAGWATSSSGAQGKWITSTNNRDAGLNAAFSATSGAAGVNELDSPSITLPHAVEQLSFRQDLAMDAVNDGGVLEIEIGSGGTWTDIIAAGGSFVTGGYNSTIASTNNPLAGRAAWSGTTGDFITTVVLLPAAAAGQPIHLRWRCGTGTGAGGFGWYVDTIRLTSSTYTCCSSPPHITLQPQDQTVVPGGEASFSVAADGTYPLTYQWLWYGTNLPGALSPTLSLTNVSALAGGPYQVVVSDPAGSVTSAVAELTVVTTTPPPVLGTILPAFGPVDGGNEVMLSGSGFQAGVAVDFGGVWSRSVVWISDTEVTAVAPPFPTASLVDVTVANPDGQSGLLAGGYTYGLPPSILAGPTNVFTWVGGTAAFSLTVTGAAPMAYQWQWGGTNLVDSAGVVGSQSNLLVLPSVTAGQAGVYSVVVSNQFGLASSPANLVVVQPTLTPVFLTTSSAGGVLSLAWAAYPGRSYQLQALTPALGLVSWVDVGGVTVATNVIAVANEVVGTAPQRYYRVFMLP